ncbi:MAG: hypothetical protein RBG13Loki_4055 [Promethearchaeota archaeon CR_4]|nr:MAG: hypothetical protein RBG13Loki_4055 [Candidatus Lokiarchaeota archaeon CR_4]
MEILKGCENPYYFSTRVLPLNLLKQFPNIAEQISGDRIFDATQIPFLEESRPKGKSKRNFEKLVFRDLSEFLELLYNKVKEHQNTGIPTVVIDSWNGLPQIEDDQVGIHPFASMKQFEKHFSEWIYSSNVNLILILEHTSSTNFDYIADGIIVLKDTRKNGLRVRKLEISKIRTDHVRQPDYSFSLEGAQFRYFEPYKFRFPEIVLRPDPIPDLNSNAISTGMQSFDDLLQVGYPQGSWILFELSNGVGQGFIQLLLPTIVNQLNLGRGVVATLPEGISLKNFEIYLEGFVDGEKIAQQFILFDRPPVTENIRSKATVLSDSLLDALGEFHHQEDLFASYIDGPVLKIIGLDKLEHLYSPDDLRKTIPNEVVYTKTSPNITVAFVKEEQSLVSNLSHLATRHYKLEMINKALFMRGIQPQTDYIAICPVISGGYLDTKFINVL